MKKLVIEFDEHEAKVVNASLELSAMNHDRAIQDLTIPHPKEILINDKNKIDSAKNKIEKALNIRKGEND